MGRYDIMSSEFAGTRRCRDCGTPMIYGRQELAIATGAILVLRLHTCRFEVVLTRGQFLKMSGTSMDSALASVVAHAIYGDVIDNGFVVNIHVRDVDVVYRA